MTQLRQSIVWVLLERGIQITLATVISAVLARTYGAGDFGTFQSYLSIASVWASVGLICSAEVLMPRYASSSARYTHIFEYAFVLRLLAATLAGLGYLYFVLVHFSANVALALPLLAIVLLNEPFGALGAYFQTTGNQRIWSRARLAGLFLKFIVIGVVSALHLPIFWVAVPYALEAIVVAVLIGWRFLGRVDRTRLQFDSGVLRELLAHGLIIGVGLSAMVWLQKLDRIHLTALEEFEKLGFYAAGMQISENWFFVATMLVHAVAGRYVFNQAGREQIRRIVRITFAFIGVALLAWAVGSALAPWVIRLIYGAEFMPAVPFLRWQLGLAVLVWGDIAMSLCLLANKQTVLFVFKWLVALLAAYVVSRLPTGIDSVPSPLHIPLTGYAVAVVFSLVYLIRRWRLEQAA